jgi:hypothetical protein
MKRVKLAALILAVTGLAGGATWAAGARSTAGPVWSEPAPVPGELAAAKAPVPAAAPASAVTGPARKAPAPTPDAARKHATPAPFVQDFAAQPGVQRQKPKGKPTAPVKVAPTIDGCDRNYGTIAQCIPIAFPRGVTDKCDWLTGHGFKALKVVGKDRQRLDPDHNGIACG